MGFVSGKIIKLKGKLNPSDTSLIADVDIGTIAGRLYFNNDLQEEWIDFTGVAASGDNYEYSGLTRGLSQTADPATAGTGKTWLAGNSGVLVAMHDQLINNRIFNQIRQEGLTYATPTARDTDLGGDGVATKAYTDIWITSTGLFYNYNLATTQWEEVDTGTATPNATEIIAGKLELATQAEYEARTTTGGSGAPLVPQMDQLPVTATESEEGLVVLSIDSEIETGTDELKYVNPKQLKKYGTGEYISSSTITKYSNSSGSGSGVTLVAIPSGASKAYCSVDINNNGGLEGGANNGIIHLDGNGITSVKAYGALSASNEGYGTIYKSGTDILISWNIGTNTGPVDDVTFTVDFRY